MIDLPSSSHPAAAAEDERRREPRGAVRLNGRYSYAAGAPRSASIGNLSKGGCCLRSSGQPLDRGTFLTVRLGSIGPVDAWVRWAEGQLCGVQFDRELHVAVLDHIQISSPVLGEQSASNER